MSAHFHAHCIKIMPNYFFSLQCVKSSFSTPKSSDLQRKLPDELQGTRCSLNNNTSETSSRLPRVQEGRLHRAEAGHRRPGPEVLLLPGPKSRGRRQSCRAKQRMALRMSPTWIYSTIQDRPRRLAVKPARSPPSSSCQPASTKSADQLRNVGTLIRCTGSLEKEGR